MLSIARHEGAELFHVLWRAADGADDDKSFWPKITPALDRIDALLEDDALEGSHRSGLASALNPLRELRGANRGTVAALLRRLANGLLSVMQSNYAFRPSVLPAAVYLKVLRAAERADASELEILGHCSAASDVAKYARLELAQVRVGIAKMVDENLAEYEFDPPVETDEAFRIIDELALADRIGELEENQMLETQFTVTHAEPLRPDYKELIKGLAMKHQLLADGSPTGSEIVVAVADPRGEADAFKARVAAFAAELESVLSRTLPVVTGGSTSITFQGPVIGSAVQAGSPGASQHSRATVDLTQATVDVETLRLCFADAKRALAETDLDDETRELVDASLAQVEKQLAKDQPNKKLLVPLVTTVATALTTVGTVGQGIDYIHKLMELLAAALPHVG